MRPQPSIAGLPPAWAGAGARDPHERVEMPLGVVLAEGTHVEPVYVGMD